MPREIATVYHPRGMFLRKPLDAIRWSKADLEDFQDQLASESPEPESVFLDFFVNALSLQKATKISWWREFAPNLAADQWWQAAVGYARAKKFTQNRELLLVDFYERDLGLDRCSEAIQFVVQEWQRSSAVRIPIVFLCWSETVLQNWQQESVGSANAREEMLIARLESYGLRTVTVPVIDPIGAIVAGAELDLLDLDTPTVVVLPSFGNDKLVQANWRMKTEARIREALEGYKE